MSHHKTARELHAEHTDSRNEAALRVRVLAGQEEHARTVARRALHAQLISALVQRPEPHAFHDATVRERISPRRAMDIPDRPGHDDIGGFGWGVIC